MQKIFVKKVIIIIVWNWLVSVVDYAQICKRKSFLYYTQVDD